MSFLTPNVSNTTHNTIFKVKNRIELGWKSFTQ